MRILYSVWRIRANNSHVWKIRSVNIKVQQCYIMFQFPDNEQWSAEFNNVSIDTLLIWSTSCKKPVFGSFRPSIKPQTDLFCYKTGKSLEILDLASLGIILSRLWTAKALIRLRGCVVVRIWHKQIFSWRGSFDWLNDLFQYWQNVGHFIRKLLEVSQTNLPWMNPDRFRILDTHA